MRSVGGRSCILAVIVSLALPVASSLARVWTSSNGLFKMEAELLAFDGKTAKLKMETGQALSIPIERLSAEDQAYLKKTHPDGLEEKKSGAPSPKEKKAPAGSRAEGVSLEVVSFTITRSTKPQPGSAGARGGRESGMIMFGPGAPGTHVRLLLSSPGKKIIGLDEAHSKIASCTDDKGTDLTKAAEKQKSPFAGKPMLRIDEGGESASMELDQPQIPAAGAAKIELKGELQVQFGEGEKSEDVADVALTKGTTIAAGSLALKIEDARPRDMGDTKMSVALESQTPMLSIKKILFLNAAGQEIATQDMGSGTFGRGKQMTYQRMIGLGEAVDRATVRIVAYERTDTASVPVNLEFGLGL